MKRVFSFRVSGALASPGVVTTVIHSTGRRRGGLVEQYRYRVNPRCYACITYAADWVYFFFFQKLRSVVPRLWRPRVAGSRHHSTGPTTSWGTGDKNLIYKICIIHHIRPTIYLKYIYIYISNATSTSASLAPSRRRESLPPSFSRTTSWATSSAMQICICYGLTRLY